MLKTSMPDGHEARLKDFDIVLPQLRLCHNATISRAVMLSESEASAFSTPCEKKQILRLRLRMTF